MPKPSLDSWIIEDDEFHPDARVAAVFADHNARLFVRTVYQDELKRLNDKPELSQDERERARLFAAWLHDVEQEIIEYNDTKEDDQ